jgi:IS5 family transposase
VLVDSTPVEAGRSVDTSRRSALADAAGYSRSHSRWFSGFRLHLACSPDGTPRAAMLVGADRKEREIARTHLLPRLAGSCHTIVADKGYAGHELAEDANALGITLIRPRRADEPKPAKELRLTTIRQRIESVFWTLKDLLSLEQHGARTLHNLRARIGCRLLCLAACVKLNHQLGRPTRNLATYTA